MFDFTYDVLTEEQKKAYLARIGCEGLSGATKETLDTLVYQHQCSVPFESLELFYGAEDISLETEDLFRKVIVNRRGGFCFELNGIFVLLLRSLGFDAVSVMCRVAANRDFLGDVAHRATLVRLDGKEYLCDVGMGGPMAPFAVEISAERQTKHGETYWVEKTYEGWYLEKRITSQGEEAATIVFGPQAFLAKDFYPPCRAMLAKPGCMFKTRAMANLRTPDGYFNFAEHTLSVTKNGVKTDRTVTDSEIPAMLETYFGIRY